jgi:hypothetical protein
MPRVYEVAPEGFRAGEMTMQVAMDVLSFPDMPMVRVDDKLFPLERIPLSIFEQNVSPSCYCTRCLESGRRPDPSSAEAGAPEGKS